MPGTSTCPVEDGEFRTSPVDDQDETGERELDGKSPDLTRIAFPREAHNRVKLYVLCEQRIWDDRGTGHVACVPLSSPDSPLCLVVRLESTHKNVLESRILLDTVYQKQQETLIVWSESDTCDLALSFQEKAGCEEIWARICQVQGRDPSLNITQDVGPVYDGETDEGDGNESGPAVVSLLGAHVQLPPCEISRLAEIDAILSTSMATQAQREKTALALESQNYIAKLCDLFHMCEDLENLDALKLLYSIAKHLFMLNRNGLLEVLLSEAHFKDIVGMLEYDPALQVPRRHRQFLWERARFKEVLPMKSEELRCKIHQTYRVQYVQDVCLPAPSLFEENLLSALNSQLFFNRVDIVAMLQEDDNFLTDLFAQLCERKVDVERRRELTLFLKEFCSFSQSLQQNGPQGKDAFFKTLMAHDVLATIEPCLASPCSVTRAASIEMFAMVVDYSPQVAREYLLQQARTVSNDANPDVDNLLVNKLIGQLFRDSDPELSSAQQLTHVLQLLVDPENMLTNIKSEKAEFLSFFYKRAMHTLVAPLIANTQGTRPIKDDYHTAHKQSLVLRLLCFCVEHHSFSMRTYCINHNLIARVLVLLASRHAFLALGALRLLRRVVQLKDDFYYRHLMRANAFAMVADCFQTNGKRYNLLNSAIIELFEFIRTEDIKPLICHIVETCFDAFKTVDYVKTFIGLRTRYDQHKSRSMEIAGIRDRSLSDSSHSGSRESSPMNPPTSWKRGEHAMDRESEEWFNEDEEDWDGAREGASSGERGLNGEGENRVLSPSASPSSPARRGGNTGEEDAMSPQRKTGSEPMFPSVKRKVDDDYSTVFAPSTMVNVGRVATPRIVIRVSSDLAAKGASPPHGEYVVSSTETASNASAQPGGSNCVGETPVKKIGLVDYDESDDSDSGDDGSDGEAETISGGSKRRVIVDDDQGDVSSTSGDQDGAALPGGEVAIVAGSPPAKRSRLEADEETVIGEIGASGQVQ